MRSNGIHTVLTIIITLLLIVCMVFSFVDYIKIQQLHHEFDEYKKVQEYAEHNELVQTYGNHMLQIFRTCTVIGDSLSCGFTNYQGVSIKSERGKELGQNWPSYLEGRTGIRFNNLSIGGASAHEWRYQHIFSASGDTDCYIIALGANDHRKDLAIGSTADIADNYEYNKDSFYGNLDFIVRSLHNFQETAPVFIFTMPGLENKASGKHADCNAYNEVIRSIADRYEYVHLIDLYTDYEDAYESEVILSCFGTDHFTPIGYNYASDIMESALNQYLQDHYELFITAPYK